MNHHEIEALVNAKHPWPADHTALTGTEAEHLADIRGTYRQFLLDANRTAEAYRAETIREAAARVSTEAICRRSLEASFVNWKRSWAKAERAVAQ
jgi:hypothetical protein